MTLNAGEFMRRFLLHVLPDGFHRIRHYGLLANGHRADKLARCRELLGSPPERDGYTEVACEQFDAIEPPPCPCCGGRMRIVEAFDGPLSGSPPARRFDSS